MQKIHLMALCLLFGWLCSSELHAQGFMPTELQRTQTVSDPVFHPNGQSLVYSVAEVDNAKDEELIYLWMYQALRSLNVPTQLLVYPDQHHGLTVPSYIEGRIQRNIEWYTRYLLSEQ